MCRGVDFKPTAPGGSDRWSSYFFDDLRPTLLTHKYLDDTTVTDVVTQGSASELQQTVDGLTEWSERNKMNINNLLDNKGHQAYRLNDPASVIR